MQPFWVESEGQILATLTAVVDELYNRHWNADRPPLFFEALPNADAGITALFRTACDWLRAQGCQAARTSFPDLNQALHRVRATSADESPAALARALQAIDHGVLQITMYAHRACLRSVVGGPILRSSRFHDRSGGIS